MSNREDMPDNPAGRLHKILSQAARMSGGSIKHAFAVLLEVEEGNLGELMRMLAFLIRQAEEVGILLGALTNQTYSETYSKSLPGIKRCFEIDNFASNWDTYRPTVRPELVMALQFCSIALADSSGEKTIPPEILKVWLDRVSKLYEQAKASDIDGSLKALVLTSLERIRSAIRDYKVRGIDAIREVVFGTAIRVAEAGNEELRAQIESYKKSKQKEGAEYDEKYWAAKEKAETKFSVVDFVVVCAALTQIAQFGMAIAPLFSPWLAPLLTGQQAP